MSTAAAPAIAKPAETVDDVLRALDEIIHWSWDRKRNLLCVLGFSSVISCGKGFDVDFDFLRASVSPW